MSKNQEKENEVHHILMITDTGLVTNQLRKRLIRNSSDRAMIIAPQGQSVTPLSNQWEALFHIDLNQSAGLRDLMTKQNFDTLYLNLTNYLKSIPTILQNIKGSAVKNLILILNAKEPQPETAAITKMIKNGQIPYLIIRTARLSQHNLLSYQVVKNAQPVNDSSVSTVSVADLTFQAIEAPQLHADTDLGIAQLPYK